jgi:hypothetical protein
MNLYLPRKLYQERKPQHLHQRRPEAPRVGLTAMITPVDLSVDFHSAIFPSPLPFLLSHQIMIILLGICLNPDNFPPAKELF